MSWENYERSMELAPKCRFYTTAGGRSIEEIEEAEKLLGIKLSKQYRDFNEKYGYLSFYGNEIFGIDTNNLNELEGNSLAYALNDCKDYNLPYYFLPFYNYNDGYMAYFDYSSLNNEGEPRIVILEYDGFKYSISETVADDFGDFILKLVQDELES